MSDVNKNVRPTSDTVQYSAYRVKCLKKEMAFSVVS